MTKGKNVSHSRLNLYKQCSQKFYFRYIERWDSPNIFSALFFGIAIDETLNYVLECTMKKEPLDEDKMWKIFDKHMNYTSDGEEIKLSPNALYYKSDYAIHLLTESDLKYFLPYDDSIERVAASSLTSHYSFVQQFINDHPIQSNYLGWLSLYRKGELFLKTFLKEINHLFDEVFFVQDNLFIENNDGDVLICKPDFGIKATGKTLLESPIFQIVSETRKKLEPNKKYTIVMDNKTSGNPYKPNAVVESEQLHTYSEFYDAELAGYVVLNKKIGRNKKVNWQIIIDEVSEEFKQKVFDNISDSLYNIKQEIYEKNMSECMAYGRKCEYYDLCYYNDSSKLKKRKERK